MNNSSTFFQSLTPDILAPSEFVDWSAINKRVKVIRREIALVQSLDKDSPVDDLADLLSKEPKILNVLQLLIAHTPKEIYFATPGKKICFADDMKAVQTASRRAKEVASIFVEMGLVEFLKEVRSVEDVVKGVLIGLQPNTRKNRRGSKLEEILHGLISRTVDEINGQENLTLSLEAQMYVDLHNERKRIDYVVLQNGEQKIGIEVNFYASSGSKPAEVLGRAYPEVQQSLEAKNMGFIVITDGLGWERMKPVLATAFKKLHFLMNIKMAEKGDLKKAILEILRG